MEVTAGSAQALPLPPRGAAFVRGSLFLLRADQVVDDEKFGRFMSEADTISKQITELLRSVREAQT